MPQQFDWQPSASLETLRLRARLLALIRAFFADRSVLEVETPALSCAGVCDPHIKSFAVCYSGPGCEGDQRFYLHTSPEFPMKRLLAAGSGSIYQFARVFRDGEAGRLHNPEFTLLEWYRIGFDYHRLMDEIGSLVKALLRDRGILLRSERLTYSELFRQTLGIEPHAADAALLRACAEAQGLVMPAGMPDHDPDPWRDLLLTHCIQPNLGRGKLYFVYDYPVSQAALARLRPGDPSVAERFELYLNGIELANGFQELDDPIEQRQRFEHENHLRARRGQAPMPIDERLLAALEAGLPYCAGVALGFDRLVMIAAGEDSLQAVMPFPVERA